MEPFAISMLEVCVTAFLTAMMGGMWAYLVRFEGDGPYTFQTSQPLPTVITTERIAPLPLVLGKQLP